MSGDSSPTPATAIKVVIVNVRQLTFQPSVVSLIHSAAIIHGAKSVSAIGHSRRARDPMWLPGPCAIHRNAKWNSTIEEPRPLLYVPLAQHLVSEMTVLVAAKSDPSAIAGGVRAELARIAPDVPVLGVLTLREHMELATIEQRNTALLASGFGSLA